ncbi:16S rRNA (cytosine(1402)-N(4))-methyltransferase RsmH [Maridesulfovibrio ferrireducens]|uniref:16S rRNA (cytosine(1402)-N(4))-methyltransferase RsmH n=1 Tax=Maridesulfovibrio ferrireducens TaxID=246191 RepID=UPI001A1AFB9B|nr:16S rRNA (cytosine(1402)-N(4))-methyltransferase RsmH [Maridesulfovibrio ferrireducens]MBI9109738.1 16S rRNA (cytosine(1402)-N(4))-methyltransferase RsmH [Maridesulfovibrio ferrireducens]
METKNTTPEKVHTSVLLKEVIDWIAPKPGGLYLDGTLGMGGHSSAILEAAGEGAQLIGLDRDEQALDLAEVRLAPFGDRAHRFHLAFSKFEEALNEMGWEKIDGVILDLGVSSLHLDRAERGFSFAKDGPLDMRMDPSGGMPPASSIVNKASYSDLVRIIKMYGEEPLGSKIASSIIKAREEKKITTTLELAAIVSKTYPAKRRALSRTHPATRTFQGLRIAVNSELEELKNFLHRIPERLNPGARVAVISFHSLEDRIVKRSFRDESKECDCLPMQPVCTCGNKQRMNVLTKKPILPTEEEMEVNPRSRSAKLRVAERSQEKK